MLWIGIRTKFAACSQKLRPLLPQIGFCSAQNKISDHHRYDFRAGFSGLRDRRTSGRPLPEFTWPESIDLDHVGKNQIGAEGEGPMEADPKKYIR
jgi:hypothetical protein